jgi:hypothetical protein
MHLKKLGVIFYLNLIKIATPINASTTVIPIIAITASLTEGTDGGV